MNNGITTTINDFSFSTEADIDCFYENATSLYSNDTVIIDEDLENTNNTAMFIMIYGLGGFLVFSVIYSICTAYYIHVKGSVDNEREARHEFAEYRARQRPRRLVWPSNPSSPMDPPVFEREYMSEEMRDMVERNTRPKQIYQNREQAEMRSTSHACPVNERGYMTEEFRDMLQRSTPPNQVRQNHEQIELRPMSRAYPIFERGCLSQFQDMIQRNTRPKQLYQNALKGASRDSSTLPESESKFFPEDIPDTLQPNVVPKQVRRSREHDELRSISSASSIPAIHDRSFFYEGFQDMFRMNTIPNQVDQSFEEIELRPWIRTPPTPQETEIRLYREDFLDIMERQILPEGMHEYARQNEPKQSHIEINMTSATPERIDSVTERKSRSSPCSPHNVRRRLHSIAESPRRPSSWRT